MLANMVFFVLVAVVGGLSTSWYMIEKGTRLTSQRSGPWIMWETAGHPDADPYTRAHHMRRGTLPITSALAEIHQATTDSDGQPLYSSCEYAVEGEEPQGAFWTLAVFDDEGRIIPNPADRHSFNSTTLMRGPGRRLDVVLARNARPGNWLPTGGAGRLALHLTVEEPRPASAGPDAARAPMPAIRRVACR